ncbi:MAG: Holliday junction resolvase RuvX [Rickettsiales bacterium]|jgi:putative Holliday junction resolvase|nr:Holliday junction resolvase RuvX [Rickettsiales bacterium]
MNAIVKRFLGLDPGSRRIGVAISDWDARIALPLRVVSSVREANLIIAAEGIGTAVVGLPLEMNGREGAAAMAARAFASSLTAERVEFWDERLSSAMVEKSFIREADMSRAKRSRILDAAAAAAILQGFLDARNS